MDVQKSSPFELSLTIGAVAKATGFSPDTLRVWQKRYGFPVPQRKPSGHRLYSAADVRRLRRISEALARGHRPGQVVPLPEARLQSLLTEAGAATSAGARTIAPVASLMALVRRHDAAGLTSALLSDAATLGPVEFLRLRAVPMVQEVGEAWSRGEIGIHHEHFFSERLSDVLRAVRMPFERAAAGPRITLATLSGRDARPRTPDGRARRGRRRARAARARHGHAGRRDRRGRPLAAGSRPWASASRFRRRARARAISSRRCGGPFRRGRRSSSGAGGAPQPSPGRLRHRGRPPEPLRLVAAAFGAERVSAFPSLRKRSPI